MKNISIYAQELLNVVLGIIPFFTAIFNGPIADTNDLDKKLVTPNDRRKFQAAVDDLRKSENKGQTRTITLSNNEQITIAVG
jgi:hypothetical protein